MDLKNQTQRQIKFRAFENKNGRNRMFDWSHIKKDFDSWLNDKDTFVMQFTGLKDKNGVEIYDSDVVSNGKYLFEVQFNVQQGKWCLNPFKCIVEEKEEWFLTALEYSQLGNGYYSRKDLEVIGNIHQHNKLLTN